MLRRSTFLLTSSSSKHQIKHQVAIIGSGPSGCYVAQQLTKSHPSLHVDIYEKLPIPFGLSRYGVAPDHPEVKNVEKTFNTQLLDVPGRCTLLCNVNIGTDVSLAQLRRSYSAVVLATGCSGERHLGIPGEHLTNVISSKRLVEWYNTVPFPQASPLSCPLTNFLKIDQQESNLQPTAKQHKKVVLKNTAGAGALEQVVLIGNGNVALDIARVLAAPYKYWCPTDMNCFAVRDLMSLSDHNIQKISLVARRGVEHSAFTTKEFRELTNLDPENVRVVVEPFDLEGALDRSAKSNSGQPAQGLKRKLELMKKFEINAQVDGDFETLSKNFKGKCLIIFRFGLIPIRMIARGNQNDLLHAKTKLRPDADQVAAVVCEIASSTQFSSHPEKPLALLPADAVITCVGYAGEKIRTLPFDSEKRIIPTDDVGRVVISDNNNNNTKDDDDDKRKNVETSSSPFLYSVGWARNGPKGVIAASLADAKLVSRTILDDLAKWDEKFQSLFASDVDNENQQSQQQHQNQADDEQLIVEEVKEQQHQEINHDDDNNKDSSSSTTIIINNNNNNNSNHNTGLQIAFDSRGEKSPRGKYDLIDYFIQTNVLPLGVSAVRRIWRVEIEKGIDLGKRMEKVASVSDMLNLATGGKLAKKTEDKFRGRPILGRPRGLELMSDYLDPKTLLADMSEEWMRKGEQDMLDEVREVAAVEHGLDNNKKNLLESSDGPKHDRDKFFSSPPTASLLETLEPNLLQKKK